MSTRNMVAVDLGAESGRIILARFDGRNMSLEEIHRFPNRPVMVHGHRFWNVLGLWDEMLSGLRKARKLAGSLDSIGVDTWGLTTDWWITMDSCSVNLSSIATIAQTALWSKFSQLFLVMCSINAQAFSSCS